MPLQLRRVRGGKSTFLTALHVGGAQDPIQDQIGMTAVHGGPHAVVADGIHDEAARGRQVIWPQVLEVMQRGAARADQVRWPHTAER